MSDVVINNNQEDNVNQIDQTDLDQYVGDNVDQAVDQVKTMYPNFDVYRLHQDLMITANYIANRIIVKHNNQFVVTSVIRG